MNWVNWIAEGCAKRIVRVEVRGPSMLPTLIEGDRLLVSRTRQLRSGDLVAFADPEVPERILIKRVASILDGSLIVRGDNERISRDSSDFGPISAEGVVGRAWYRYYPAQSRGRLARRQN